MASLKHTLSIIIADKASMQDGGIIENSETTNKTNEQIHEPLISHKNDRLPLAAGARVE